MVGDSAAPFFRLNFYKFKYIRKKQKRIANSRKIIFKLAQIERLRTSHDLKV